MVKGVWPGRLVSVLTLGLALAAGSGCRISSEDVHRWATTAQGPRKLVAVLVHDKYALELRVEAALTLIGMKPRGGRRIGIQGTDEQQGLIDALTQMQPAARGAIIERLIPKLEEEMQKPPPVAPAGQATPTDPSIPYKDASFALLTHDDGVLMPDDNMKRSVRAALASWATTNFAERMDDSSQMFGLEQMLRELKADGVRSLPNKMLPGTNKLDRMADLVADFGDADTKLRASEKLVAVAKEINSENWLRQNAAWVEAANKASKLNPTPDQFKAQLAQTQEEALLRIFSSMKKLGGKPVVDYLLAFARDKSQPEKRRASALAALQGNLDRNNPQHVQAVLSMASEADTPDSIRDVALQRVGEFPRQMVIDRLFELFKSDNWKVRWVSAELVLKMSDTTQIPIFMQKLGQAQGMAMTEPLRYGALIADLKGPETPQHVADKYLGLNNPVQARLTALGYYYQVGTADQIPKVDAFAKDLTRAPECRESAKECEWKCTVGGASGEETKEIKTVGEFVEFCVKPAMQKRAKAGAK